MKDVYETITNTICADLEKGIIPWRRAWSVGTEGCFSYATQKPYSLLNTLMLEGVSGDYVTFKGAQKAGGTVKRGEKAHTVFFWNMIEKEVEENGVKRKQCIPVLRAYSVFHTSQCENVAPKHDFSVQTFETKPIDRAEKIIADYIAREGLTVEIGDYNEAYYAPASDRVQLPRIERYQDSAEYYSTVFHELAHSTGAEKRLNRADSKNREAYAREELVAELASAFLMNTCGIETADTFKNSEGYVQGWLKALRNDKRLIVSAASRAEKAVARILGTVSEATEAEA